MPSAVKTDDSSLCFVKREFEFRSGISPYICSTWHDLQEEHSLLSSHVFPELHSVCRARRVYFEPIHLVRPGHNDLSGSFLTSCLKWLDRCAPFFLCLLGERYGSDGLPSDHEDSIRERQEAGTAGYEWVLEESCQACSELELQVTEAAFRLQSEYCHFYYRKPEYKDLLYTDLDPQQRTEKLQTLEPESPHADLKLRALKQRIINKGHRVRYYDSLEHFYTQVRADWKGVIDLLCPPLTESLNICTERDEEIYQSWLSHEQYAEIRRRDFLSLPEHDHIMSELTQFALTALDDPQDSSTEPGNAVVAQTKDNKSEYPPAQYQSVLTLVGDRGSGKTSLLAQWVKEFTEEYGFVRVFTHFVGVNDQSLSGVAMLKRCMSFLSNELHNNLEYLNESGGSEQTLSSLGEIFTAALSHQPCVIVLDGLDDLGKSCVNPSQQVRELSWLLYPLPPHVRFIVSSCRSDTSYQKLSKRPDTRVLEMPTLSNVESKMEMLRHYLGSCQHLLNTEQLDTIGRSRQLEKPLFVQLLATELRQQHILSDLNQYLENYLETCSVRELVGKMIRHWVKIFSWNINKNAVQAQGFKKQTDTVRDTSGWVAEILRLIAVSRDGLTHSELLQLLQQIGYHNNSGVSECQWMMFCDVLSDSILYQTPEGVLRYRHLHIREAIEHALLSPDSPQQAADYSVKVVVPKKKLDPSKERKQIEKVVYSRHLSRFFSAQPHSDRKRHELPWHLAGSRDYVKLKQALSEPRLFTSLYSHTDYRAELLCLWAVLQVAGYDPSQTYTDMLSLAAHINDVPEIRVGGEELTSDDPLSAEKTILETNTSQDLSTSGVTSVDLDALQLYSGQVLGDLAHYDTGLRILSDLHTSLSQRIPLPSPSELLLCRVEAAMASQLLQMDMLAESTTLYERALSRVSDMLVALLSPAEEGQLVKLKGSVLTSLASLYVMQLKTREAELALRHASHCMKRSHCSMGAAQVLFNKGVLRLEQHQFHKADQCFTQALAAYRKWYGPHHHKVADVLHEYAGMLCDSKNTHRYDKQAARRMYSEALQLREKHYGKSHLIVAETLCQYGQLLKSLSGPECRSEALSMLRRALDIRSTHLGPTHGLTKQAYSVLNDLEISLQYHSLPHFYSDRRPDNTLYTSLSWHEAELLQFQLKKSRRIAQKRNNKLAMAVKVIGMLKAMTSTKRDVTAQLKGPNSVQTASQINDTTYTNSDTDIGLADSQFTGADSQSDGMGLKTCGREGEEPNTKHVTVNHEGIEGDIKSSSGTESMTSKTKQGAVNHSEKVELSMKQEVFSHSEEVELNTMTAISHSERVEPSNDSHVVTSDKQSQAVRSVSGRPVSHVEIRPRVEYLENYGSPVEVPVEKRILRPQSAPYKMLQKYSTSVQSSQVSIVKHAKRHVSSAPTHVSPHQRTCQPPKPHAIHPANTRSVVNGPNTSTESLLQSHISRPTPPQHTSAWYHVPGRYSTPTQNYPPKRSQKRHAQRRLLKNLHTRKTSPLLSSTFPTQLENRIVRY